METHNPTSTEYHPSAAALLEALVESSQDAIIAHSTSGVIVSWNAAAERMYGYSANEVIGRPLSIIIPADKREEIVSLYRRIANGERVGHLETARVAKDGRSLDISLTLSRIFDRAGV